MSAATTPCEPHFSIALPAYNSGGTLSETLDSVIAQTFDDWEVVIVDDGSSDSTGAIADEYAARDSRIRVIHQANAGCGPARGTAVENARGRLIARLDQDDLYIPTYLETMARLIEENPDFEIYSCNGEMFFPDGRTMLYHRDPRYAVMMSLSFGDMADENGIFSPAVFRREIYDAVGGFRDDVYAEDYDLWLRTMARGARHLYTPEVLVRYRVSEGQMTDDWIPVWESAVGLLGDLRRSGTLNREQKRQVRASLRKHWHWRAWKAYEALRGRESEGRPLGDYFPERGRHAIGIRILGFVLLTAVVGLRLFVEGLIRGAVSGMIHVLRMIFPSLRDVRLRKADK